MVIYRPKGRAGEYADWACNPYRGCPHGCAYCFSPDVLRRTGITRYQFRRDLEIRKNIVARVQRDLKKVPEEIMVHLSFTCDPYPNYSVLGAAQVMNFVRQHVTRNVIQAIKDTGRNTQILTKGRTEHAIGDLDLLDEHDQFGVTLTLDNVDDSRLWEPHAASPQERIVNLEWAHRFGIFTWVSLEPIIYPEQSLHVLEMALSKVPIDLVKAGPLNYKERLPRWLASTIPDVDWKKFVLDLERLCQEGGTELYLKDDLKALLA